MHQSRAYLLYLLYLRKKRRKEKKRLWVKPLLLQRDARGAFATLFEELREDNQNFFNYFRMSISTFDELLDKLNSTIQKENTVMRECISPVERLAVTVRYLSSGSSLTELHHAYRLGISTISGIVDDVCASIWQVLSEECIPEPSMETMLKTASDFEKKANFPHCIGCVGEKHIRIVKPQQNGSLSNKCKSCFSIVVTVVADCNYRFIFANVGSYGIDSDPTPFESLSFWKAIEKGQLGLPEPKPLSPNDGRDVPFVLVGDKSFALHPNLMRPYLAKLSAQHTKKRVFNYRMSRAHNYVESAFGILSNKWRIFHRPFNVSVPLAIKIVQACCVLHNFTRDRDGYNFEDTLCFTGLNDASLSKANRGSSIASDIRETFANYFVSEEGSIPLPSY